MGKRQKNHFGRRGAVD